MNARRRYLRDSIRSVLFIFSSTDVVHGASAKAQLSPSALFELWRSLLDDLVREPALSESERQAVHQFNAALEALLEQAGTVEPEVEQLVRLSGWANVETEANNALRTIAA